MFRFNSLDNLLNQNNVQRRINIVTQNVAWEKAADAVMEQQIGYSHKEPGTNRAKV